MAFHNVPPNGFPDLPDVEELEAVQKDVTNLKTTTAEHGAAITNLNSTKANKTDIATEFSDLTNYYAGDLVYYDGALYEFQVDHTAGAWETSEVIQKDLSDIVTTLKSGLTTSEIEITGVGFTTNNFKAYRTGNTVIISGYGIGSWNGTTALFTGLPEIPSSYMRFKLFDGDGNMVTAYPAGNNTSLQLDNVNNITKVEGEIVYPV